MAITSFIPELWAARLLNHYTRKTVVAQLLNRNYEGMIQQYGDTVHINSLADITVKKYTPNVDIDDPEQLSTEDQVLSIDHGAYYNFYIDDVDKAQARGELMDTAMSNAADRLAQDTEDYVISVLLAGAKDGGSGALTKDNTYESILALKTKMDEGNVPREGRKLIVPPSVEGFLLLDNRFVTGGNGENRLTEGAVARAAGFDIYMSTGLTDTMIAMRSEDATFANQITKIEAYRPEKKFADGVKGLALCGAKVTNPDGVYKYTIGG
nr:hypothetical protein [Clostridia bacterium]